ncbi:MAG: hypothetical protein K6E36_01345 [Oscillospiraceae bacterium]|nr:hypothetical protein [Oscillospiraceae bacterium]
MNLNLPQQDGPAKFFSILQFIVFLALFIGLYLFLRRLTDSTLLRIVFLIGDYIVCALISFCLLKPLSDKAAAEVRSRKKK